LVPIKERNISMKFKYLGKLKNTTDLRTASLKFQTLKRNEIKVAVIDNESFDMLEILEQHKFDIFKFDDIENLDTLLAYDIILCDIKGVGLKFNKTFQGAYLIKEIYKKYPFKIIIAYTGTRYDARYNEYLKFAEFSIKKDASSEEWVEKLDTAIEYVNNPEHRWNRIKNYLLSKDVPLFNLALVEDDFVDRILNKKSFEGFPKSNISKKFDSDIRAILQSFTSNVLFKLIWV
jgi:hypothetical protein